MTMAPEQPPVEGRRTPPRPADTVVSASAAYDAVKRTATER